MKFFTLDLYRRFNSSDVDEAIRADADWEDATARYKAELQVYRDDLPPGAKKLAEEIDLHDAQILGIGSEYLATGFPSFWIPFGPPPSLQIPYPIVSQMAAELIITLRVADEISIILYSLWNQMDPPVFRDRHAADRVYWLYDEIVPDRARSRHFWHNILLSDESTLEIPFIDCVFWKVDLNGNNSSIAPPVTLYTHTSPSSGN
jgi:hypothetical protein